MKNLTRYKLKVRYSQEEGMHAVGVVRQEGEWVKFSDIAELLQTVHNNARDAIDECRGCLYDGQCVYPRPCVVDGKSCRSTAPVA